MISDLVYVEGKLHYRDFTDKQGVQRTRTEILQSMFDCTFCLRCDFEKKKALTSDYRGMKRLSQGFVDPQAQL